MAFEAGPTALKNAAPVSVDAHRIIGLRNQFRPLRFPTLPGGRPNPSSSSHDAPVSNMAAPWSGKPGYARGHFAWSTGTLVTEMGFNTTLQVREDVTDLTDGAPDGVWNDVGAGNEEHSDPKLTAGYWTGLFIAQAGSLVGTYTVEYLDDRDDPDAPLFAFRISGTTRFQIRSKTGFNCLDTFGIAAEVLTYVNSVTGIRTLHTEEWIILEGNNEEGTWLTIDGCTFDLLRSLVGTDNAPDAPCVGYSKLSIQASHTLADLGNDWLDPAKFVEGVNLFTLIDESVTSRLTNPLRYASERYGTDLQVYVSADQLPAAMQSETYPEATPFPAGQIRVWLPGWSANNPRYKYWRIGIVNRGNATGRISFGYPILDAGFAPEGLDSSVSIELTPERGWDSRTSYDVADDGTILPTARPGGRTWAFAYPAFGLTDRDVALLDRCFHAPPAAIDADVYPRSHQLGVDLDKLALPVVCIDPVFDPDRGRYTAAVSLVAGTLSVPITGIVTVVSDPDSQLAGVVTVGDIVSGYYRYPLALTDTDGSPTVGAYATTVGDALGAFVVTAPGIEWVTLDGSPLTIDTENAAPDTLDIRAGLDEHEIHLELEAPAGSALTSDDLPTEAPDLALWTTTRRITITGPVIPAQTSYVVTIALRDPTLGPASTQWARGSVFGFLELSAVRFRGADQAGVSGKLREAAPKRGIR